MLGMLTPPQSEVEDKGKEWRRVVGGQRFEKQQGKKEYIHFMDESEGEVRMQGNNLKRVNSFVYLGSAVAEVRNLDCLWKYCTEFMQDGRTGKRSLEYSTTRD